MNISIATVTFFICSSAAFFWSKERLSERGGAKRVNVVGAVPGADGPDAGVGCWASKAGVFLPLEFRVLRPFDASLVCFVDDEHEPWTTAVSSLVDLRWRFDDVDDA